MNDKIFTDIQAIAPGIPITVTTDRDGGVTVDYETEWKEGGTKPKINKKGEVTGYIEQYEDKKLTKDQIKKIDEYIASL